MPVFLHSESSELNPFLEANKKTFSNLRKKFQNEPLNDIGQTNDGYRTYVNLSGILTKIISTLGEILYFGNRKQIETSGLFAGLMNATTSLHLIIENLPNLSQLTLYQYQGISSMITQINQMNIQLNSVYGNKTGVSLFLQAFNNVVNRLKAYQIDSQVAVQSQTMGGIPAPNEDVNSESDDEESIQPAPAIRSPATRSRQRQPNTELYSTPPQEPRFTKQRFSSVARNLNSLESKSEVELRQMAKDLGVKGVSDRWGKSALIRRMNEKN